MNAEWVPACILPNLSSEKSVDGGVIALVPHDDPRVLEYSATHSKFADLLSRFTDAFGVQLVPVVMMVRKDQLSRLSNIDALASFRDLVVASTVPYGRSLASIYPNGGRRIAYANSFWLYPWMLGTDNENLVLRTPAMDAFHVVDEFHGQSSPEMPDKELKDID